MNGLRGVAIILVVVFHGFRAYLPNGRVGVDIFFVLSGYLISSIIFKERANGKFTYKGFYARRIKRLSPALIFFLAYLLYLIQDLYYLKNTKRLISEAKQIMASILMSENFFLMKQTWDHSLRW